ncbi:GNAT family N-acetyltransferase [Streptomyces clavuligerus]|uniref:Putative acetyltransferase n=1 Tax=Streptomyces clavuligerus TaxID=1901 RepID=E2Q783_STRCL|nr:GNAT family N-acetyltransferase [Streptomyces clavuligerus]ANW21508.1 GCN5 family acetyltransferase [Streptomyces clavuligerus]AXU16141.1 GNAT family N-acetyltransferase [Streptomyces clavuligerus]EFG05330.1 Putative acetyltransferase [Streptomyces clavuligerus]MBY6306284.1 GNAT family N-acetyltransferase [Streptomyces clavuligerus]QCS08920.1 N-acetyltransferase [Streptomyces clavuligerus]
MSNPLTQDATGLTVAPAPLEDWHLMAEWAAAEGWNPGDGDIACFHPTDPAGFFIGRIDGEPVSAVSVVNYDERYAFLGFYLVVPEARGRGLGLATWRAAFPHAGDRLVGLDAVPAQQANYERSGFSPAYGNVRWAGRPRRTGEVAAGTVPVTPERLPAITAYDSGCHPAERPAFLARWLTAPGHTAYARLREGRVTGYGVIRPSRDGNRIGPLFADSRDDAEALFDSLTAHLGPEDVVAVDMPEPLAPAAALAADRGLEAQFPTVRMYTGPAPEVRTDRIFGATSLELG